MLIWESDTITTVWHGKKQEQSADQPFNQIQSNSAKMA